MWKNWFIYLLALLCAAVFTMLYLKQSALIVLVMMAAVPPFVSLVTCLSARKRCRIYFADDVTALEKEIKSEIGILIENTSELNIGNAAWIVLSVRNGMETKPVRKKKKIYLTKGSQRIVYAWQPEHIGVHEIAVEKLTVLGSFALFHTTIRSGEMKSFLIMPEYREFPIGIEAFHEEKEGESERFSAVKPGNDPSELYDIREYRPGDKVNRIHWKFSAKNGRLMVQDYGFGVACDTAVFFDLSEDASLQEAERASEILYFIVFNYLEKNRFFYVLWKDNRREGLQRRMITGEGEVYDLFHEIFCCGRAKGGKVMEEIYRAQFESECLSDGIFIYAGRKNLDEEYTRRLLRADRMQFVPVSAVI